MAYTYKQKFNKKYKQKLAQPNSLKDIAKLTGYKLSGLKKIFEKGEGAWESSGPSRPGMQKQQWAYSRVYSAVMGGKAEKFDKDLLIKI
jgi:hypothetical protein